MMKIGLAYEKRDWWGGGRRTWRPTQAHIMRYGKRAMGPSDYAVRIMSNREAKRALARAVPRGRSAGR